MKWVRSLVQSAMFGGMAVFQFVASGGEPWLGALFAWVSGACFAFAFFEWMDWLDGEK